MITLKEHLHKTFETDPTLKDEIDFESWLNGVGIAISELRKWKGYTQGDLANRMGVKQSVIARLESGHNMNCKTLWKLTDALSEDLVLFGTSKCAMRSDLEEYLVGTVTSNIALVGSPVDVTSRELISEPELTYSVGSTAISSTFFTHSPSYA